MVQLQEGDHVDDVFVHSADWQLLFCLLAKTDKQTTH